MFIVWTARSRDGPKFSTAICPLWLSLRNSTGRLMSVVDVLAECLSSWERAGPASIQKAVLLFLSNTD